MTTASKAVCGGEGDLQRALTKLYRHALNCPGAEYDGDAIESANRVLSAALASTAGAGAGDWVTVPRKVLTPFVEEHDRLLEEAPKQGFHPVEMQEQVSWHALVALKEALSAVPASPRSGAGESAKQLRSRLEEEAWSQASVVSCYWIQSRPDPDLVEVVNRDLRLLYEATHEVASPRAPAEHGLEIREAEEGLTETPLAIVHRWANWIAGATDSGEIPEGTPEQRQMLFADLRKVVSALSQGGGAGRSERAVEIRELSNGERRLEVSRSADDWIALVSVGGKLPVGIRMTEDEARQVVADLTSTLHRSEIAGRSEKGEGDGKHRILEAANTLNGEWALTIEWSDGTETVEIVGDNAAAVLGYVPEGDDA